MYHIIYHLFSQCHPQFREHFVFCNINILNILEFCNTRRFKKICCIFHTGERGDQELSRPLSLPLLCCVYVSLKDIKT